MSEDQIPFPELDVAVEKFLARSKDRQIKATIIKDEIDCWKRRSARTVIIATESNFHIFRQSCYEDDVPLYLNLEQETIWMNEVEFIIRFLERNPHGLTEGVGKMSTA